MAPPEKDEQFSLIVTNLTNEQRAIIARQDKIEMILNSQQTLLNSNQVLLATLVEQHKTLVEQHKEHEDDMKQIATDMKDLRKDGNELSKAVVEISGRVSALRWVLGIAGSVILIILSAIITHYIH